MTDIFVILTFHQSFRIDDGNNHLCPGEEVIVSEAAICLDKLLKKLLVKFEEIFRRGGL